MTAEQLIEAGRQLNRAFDLLERANDHFLPIEAALVSKRGLLDEAKRAVAAAREVMAN